MKRMQGWVGRKDRDPVEIDAIVRRADGTIASVRLSNFSDQGCRIEASDDFLIGEEVSIAIPSFGELPAQVRWALPGSAGAKFTSQA